MKDPIVINNILNEEDYQKLLKAVENPKQFEYDRGFSRYMASENKIPLLKELSDKLIPIAREVFNSKGLLPTYTLFSHYEKLDSIEPSLYKHKDDNACTYTLDMCVYQKEPWDLWVDDKAYTLYPNQALAYYGNDQMHWRDSFPNPDNNFVAMIFFHFAEPDHWWFVKGPSYLPVIRGTISEAEWSERNA
jgi:hypothetical protein